jgi:CheY-like chemotaxis protein
MPRVRLFHWKAAEAAHYIAELKAAAHVVEYQEHFQTELLRACRKSPPDAFIVDLSRLPAQGREIAIALRQSPATRNVPVIFCQGAPEKIQTTRQHLPDAVYCKLSSLVSRLQRELSKPRKQTVVPVPIMKRYAGRTAAQKLGIKEGNMVRVVDPPRDYLQVLGALPSGVEFLEDDSQPASVTLCFVHEPDWLRGAMSGLRKTARTSKLWILWRKGKSERGGVSEPLVRETGKSLGLVDYKICSVNEIWSGMLFAYKAAEN